jgi:hypothetical protein
MNEHGKVLMRIVFFLSLAVNVVVGAIYWLNKHTSPLPRSGILTQGITIGPSWNKPGPVIRLPKGLMVRDASPRSIAASDLFEPNRFSITVGATSNSIVDYGGSANLHSNGYYSVRADKVSK